MKPGDKVINVIREHEIFGKVNTISNIIGDHIYLEDRYECYSQNELQQVEAITYDKDQPTGFWYDLCPYKFSCSVGSIWCEKICDYHKKIDRKNRIVYCSYKGEKMAVELVEVIKYKDFDECKYEHNYHVGSLWCVDHCKYCKKYNQEKLIVHCSYKYTNEFQKEINYLKKRIEKLEGKL